jgi:hypothetical protein
MGKNKKKNKKEVRPEVITQVFTKDEAMILQKIMVLNPEALQKCIFTDEEECTVRDHEDPTLASFVCSIESGSSDYNTTSYRDVQICAYVKDEGMYQINIGDYEVHKFYTLISVLNVFLNNKDVFLNIKDTNKSEDTVSPAWVEKMDERKESNEAFETAYARERSLLKDAKNVYFYDMVNEISASELSEILMDDDKRKRWNLYRSATDTFKKYFEGDYMGLYYTLYRCVRNNPSDMYNFVSDPYVTDISIVNTLPGNDITENVQIHINRELEYEGCDDDVRICTITISTSDVDDEDTEYELSREESEAYSLFVKALVAVLTDLAEVLPDLSHEKRTQNRESVDTDDDDQDEFLDDEDDHKDDESEDSSDENDSGEKSEDHHAFLKNLNKMLWRMPYIPSRDESYLDDLFSTEDLLDIKSRFHQTVSEKSSDGSVHERPYFSSKLFDDYKKLVKEHGFSTGSDDEDALEDTDINQSSNDDNYIFDVHDFEDSLETLSVTFPEYDPGKEYQKATDVLKTNFLSTIMVIYIKLSDIRTRIKDMHLRYFDNDVMFPIDDLNIKLKRAESDIKLLAQYLTDAVFAEYGFENCWDEEVKKKVLMGYIGFKKYDYPLFYHLPMMNSAFGGDILELAEKSHDDYLIRLNAEKDEKLNCKYSFTTLFTMTADEERHISRFNETYAKEMRKFKKLSSDMKSAFDEKTIGYLSEILTNNSPDTVLNFANSKDYDDELYVDYRRLEETWKICLSYKEGDFGWDGDLLIEYNDENEITSSITISDYNADGKFIREGGLVLDYFKHAYRILHYLLRLRKTKIEKDLWDLEYKKNTVDKQ